MLSRSITAVIICLALSHHINSELLPHPEVSPPLEYAVIIDAGSAGSRVHVFSWSSTHVLDTLREVCVKKIHPAISTFHNRKKKLAKYILSLTNYAGNFYYDSLQRVLIIMTP